MTTFALNKKALFNYEVMEKFEAGISLSGPETKAIRLGQANLKGAFVVFHGDEPSLINANISRYKYSAPNARYDPLRSRPLLLKKREIAYLRGKTQEKGLTIVPLALYNKRGLIKLEIALVRGKKIFDKRKSIRERETQRTIRRALSGKNAE